jgi:hypothetical protein
MLAVAVLALLPPFHGLAAPLVDLFHAPASTGTPTPVSAQDISTKFVRPARFSQIAYCPSNVVQVWDCKPSCQALQMDGFTPLSVGGGECL